MVFLGYRKSYGDESFRDVPAVAAAFDCYLLSLVACHFVCGSQLEMYGIA